MDISMQLLIGYHVLISSCVFGRRQFQEPILDTEPEKIIVGKWDDATLPCEVTNRGNYEVKWIRDNGDVIWTSRYGRVIDNDSFKCSNGHDMNWWWGPRDSYDLDIHNVLQEYAGKYTCSVNTTPIQEKVVTLDVLYAPLSNMRPESITVNKSSDAIFKCSADGNPTPSVTWGKREGQLPHERSAILEDNSLYIANVQLSDQGEYWCKVENSQSSMYIYANLEVQASPFINMPPVNTTVIVGQTAKLRCRFGGNPEPAVLWRKLGSRDNSSDDTDRFLYKGGLLTIQSVHKADEGVYVFDAVNILGNSTISAMLSVVDTPVEVTLDGSEHYFTVTEGKSEQATLPCNVTYKQNPNEINWKNHYNIIIEGDDKTCLNFPGLSLLNMASKTVHLSIANPKLEDAGIYKCSVTTSPEDETTVVLTVLVEPVLTTSPEDQDVFINMDVLFQCEASGFPIPNITWVKVEGNFPKDRYEVLANNNLYIWNLTKSDQGTYQCRAENSLKTITAEANLFVLVKPSVSVLPQTKLAEVGDDVSFQCEAQGNPEPNIEWFKDGEGRTHLQSVKRYTIDRARGILRISNVGREDEGRYICRGSSKAGQTEALVTFRILENDNSQKNNKILKLLTEIRGNQKKLEADQNKTNRYLEQLIAHDSEL